MENRKPKVVFTYMEAGFGHITPMSGMAKAFSEKYGDKCEVSEIYPFSDSQNKSVRKMGKTQVSFIKLLSKSKIYGKLEGISYNFSSAFVLKVIDLFFLRGRRKFFKEFKDYEPDLLVSSFYQPSHLARESNDRGLTNTLIATYSPDPYIYPAWDRKCDVFLVNNENAESSALKNGFKKEQVKRVPFIFSDKVKNYAKDKKSAREELGIKDEFTVLITSGAYGAEKNKKLVKRLFASDAKMNVVMIFGEREKAIPKFMKFLKNKKEGITFYPIGFTDKMAEYMVASDVIIGKTGSNTVAEAAHFKRPMILNATASKLEEITADYYVKTGVATKITSPRKIVSVIENEIRTNTGFYKDEERYKAFEDVSGAERAADILYELLKTKFQNV